ncbi:hypothetical protein E4U41_007478 [Claviceps citrina]|nr:hypothetical protein E4U41_007478 [Claviceps citrina]
MERGTSLRGEQQALPDVSVVPLHTFPVKDEFVLRHEQGTMIEMHNEEMLLRRLNEQAQALKCWVISPIPNTTTAFHRSWLLLVQPSNGMDGAVFPNTTDSFRIDMLSTVRCGDDEYSLVHLSASRVPNPFESIEAMRDDRARHYAAFKVDVPRSWKNVDGDNIELDLMMRLQTTCPVDNGADIDVCLRENDCQLLKIDWDIQSTTFEVELEALRYLADEGGRRERRPTIKSRRAFQMILDFNSSWKDFYDLHKAFPQLKNPAHAMYKIPAAILERYRSLNQDHLDSLNRLQMIPNGLYFVNGCPGSGKTEWNMILAAMVQASTRRCHLRRSRVLFLVDINKTVDDAAARYSSLCKEAELDIRIVRMHGWPREMRESSRIHCPRPEEQQQGQNDMFDVDFTTRFLTTAGLSRCTRISQDPDAVPTLDEASWQYFEKNKTKAFPGLQNLLEKMESGELISNDDWKTLRRLVAKLYRVVLARIDFIATTPVAAFGRFSEVFKPDLIFVDEASHARELTTLIPIAYYSPKAWIFTGDVKQTQPFVKNQKCNKDVNGQMQFNPFVKQLQMSTMARASFVGAINSELLINKRAYGNLHRLPSDLFYGGRMKSSHKGEELYPESVSHLRRCLQNLAGGRHVDENRLILDLTMSREEREGASFWNPVHHQWVLAQAASLLGDDGFQSIRSGHAATIMIATPYKTAFKQYQAAVKAWPQEWQDRVRVLTVDRAQGSEADVVFLDMVRSRTSGFMDDPRRLNVSITRARQAEIILMRRAMAYAPRGRGEIVRSTFLSNMWEDTMSHGRVLIV